MDIKAKYFDFSKNKSPITKTIFHKCLKNYKLKTKILKSQWLFEPRVNEMIHSSTCLKKNVFTNFMINFCLTNYCLSIALKVLDFYSLQSRFIRKNCIYLK